MELRHLIYFRTVAQELHFRRAADRLCISQPPLSRQIRELEDELGAVLFERNNKRVTLTDAGRYFKQEVDGLISRLEEARNTVRRIHEAESGELRIGYISSTYQAHLVNCLREIRSVFPFVRTSLYEVPTVKQVRALEEGKLDIGIMRAPVHSDQLKQITLFRDRFVVVIPPSALQFESAEQLGKYLKEQPFIFFNREYAPHYHQQLEEICQRMGFSPNIVHEANNLHSILRLVENGLGVSIVPHSLQEQYAFLKLTFIDMPALPFSTEVLLAYNPRQSHAALEWFIAQYTAGFTKGSDAN
jgi:DNA-binding transcriptional LysR family regulator